MVKLSTVEPCIPLRRGTHERPEVTYEMSLVVVAQIDGQGRKIHALSRTQAFGGLVDALARDDPFGSDPDMPMEQALEFSGMEVESRSDVIGRHDGIIIVDICQDGSDEDDVIVHLGKAFDHEGLEPVDHAIHVSGLEYIIFERNDVDVEDPFDRNGRVGDRCHGITEERTEGTGSELHTEGTTRSFQYARERSGHDAEGG